MDVPHPAILKTFLLLGNTLAIKGSVEYSVPHLVISKRLLTSEIRSTRPEALYRKQSPRILLFPCEEEVVFQAASCSRFHSQLCVLWQLLTQAISSDEICQDSSYQSSQVLPDLIITLNMALFCSLNLYMMQNRAVSPTDAFKCLRECESSTQCVNKSLKWVLGCQHEIICILKL